MFKCVCINSHPVPTIPTDARLHVHWSHEAVVAQTAILSRNVGTLATVTDVRIIFTLINVWRYKINIKWKPRWLYSAQIFFPIQFHSGYLEWDLLSCDRSAAQSLRVSPWYLRTTSRRASGHSPRGSCNHSSLLHWCTACHSLRSLSCIRRYLGNNMAPHYLLGLLKKKKEGVFFFLNWECLNGFGFCSLLCVVITPSSVFPSSFYFLLHSIPFGASRLPLTISEVQ